MGLAMKALVRAPFAEQSVQRLGRKLDVTYEPWIEERRLYGPGEMAERIQKEDIAILVVEADFLSKELFEAPNLKLAGVCRNALNQVDLEAATRRGVPVIFTPNRNTTSVAELAINFMLMLGRHIPQASSYVVDGKWTNPMDAYIGFRGREVSGSVVGIVGLGQIGSQVAKRARALGARVIAHDPYVNPRRARSLGVRLVSLRQLLRRADFVTFHTPLTGRTEPLVDGAAMDLMMPTAYLINTGAANILDYDALEERLRTKRIAGAALDVFPGFALDKESKLPELDNVILTPHIGGATEETIVRQSRMIVDDIERFLSGKRPMRMANPDALPAPHGR